MRTIASRFAGLENSVTAEIDRMLSHANSIQRPFVLDRAVRRSSHGAQNEFDVKIAHVCTKNVRYKGSLQMHIHIRTVAYVFPCSGSV